MAKTLEILLKLRDEATTALDNVQKQIDDMNKAEQQRQENLKGLGIGLAAAGAAVTAFGALSLKTWMETGDQIDKMSKRTGMSAVALSELSLAAKEAGADLAVVELGSRTLSRAIIDASEGMKEYQDSFVRLGVSWDDLRTKNPEDQLFAVLSALAAMPDPTTRAATAMDLLGRSGTRLLPILSDGEEGFEDLRKRAHELGLVFDEDAAAGAAKMKDQITELTESFKGFMFVSGEFIAGVLGPFVEMATEALGIVNRWADANPVLADTITAVVFAGGGMALMLGTLILLLPKATALMGAFGVAINAALGPWGWAAAALAALIGALVAYTSAQEHANEATREEAKATLEAEMSYIEQVLREETMAADQRLSRALSLYTSLVDEDETYTREVIANMREVSVRAQDEYDRMLDSAERYYDMVLDTERVKSHYDALLEAGQELHDQAMQNYQNEYEAALREIDLRTEGRLAELRLQLRALDEAEEAQERATLEERKAFLENQLAGEMYYKDRTSAEQELAGIIERLRQMELADQRQLINDEIAAVQEQAQDERDAAADTLKSKQENWSVELTDLETHLADKRELINFSEGLTLADLEIWVEQQKGLEDQKVDDLADIYKRDYENWKTNEESKTQVFLDELGKRMDAIEDLMPPEQETTIDQGLMGGINEATQTTLKAPFTSQFYKDIWHWIFGGGEEELPGHQAGGIAWYPHTARVAEKEPEMITPLSKVGEVFGSLVDHTAGLAANAAQVSNQYNITLQVGVLTGDEVEMRRLADRIWDLLEEKERYRYGVRA